MKLKIKNIMPYITFYYPTLYTLTAMVGIESIFSRLMLIVSLIVLVNDALKNNKSARHARYWLIYIFILAIVNAFMFGYAYLFHVDCYGFLLLLATFAVYSNEERLDSIKSIIEKPRNGIRLITSFYILILISIVFLDGARLGDVWGLSFRILYGPYSVTHNIAYQLIIIYAVASYNFRSTKKSIFLFAMIASVICCVWTVARSGLLAMALVIITDYFSVRKVSVKTIIAVVGVIAFMYLGLFTNVLTDNPIVQKSIISAQSGSISNGRELFSAYMMNYYLNSTTFVQRLFGISLYRIRSLMKIRWYVEIHTHNDFVNMLVGFGTFGLIGYVVSFFSLAKRTPKRLLFLLILVVLAWFNGLYMYVSFVPAIPTLVVFYRSILSGGVIYDQHKTAANRSLKGRAKTLLR